MRLACQICRTVGSPPTGRLRSSAANPAHRTAKFILPFALAFCLVEAHVINIVSYAYGRWRQRDTTVLPLDMQNGATHHGNVPRYLSTSRSNDVQEHVMARSRSERGADETRDCSEGQKKNLKQALIIAGSRGLGLGPVREYLVRGWQVIVTARTPSAELDALCQRFSGQLAL